LMSSRRAVIRLDASGPWQAKQFSEKMGRMSRLNWTVAAAAATPVEHAPIATKPTSLEIRMSPELYALRRFRAAY